MIPGRPDQTREELVRLAQTQSDKNQNKPNRPKQIGQNIQDRTIPDHTKPHKPEQKKPEQISLDQTKVKQAKPDKT